MATRTETNTPVTNDMEQLKKKKQMILPPMH